VRRVGIGTNIVALRMALLEGSSRGSRVTLIVDSELQISNAGNEMRACGG
jgi:hypothetical protein